MRLSPSSDFADKKGTGAAVRSFSRHGASGESARAGAARFFCGWTRSAPAGRRHRSDRLRNAETGKLTQRRAPGRIALASAGRVQRRHRLLQHRQNGTELGHRHSDRSHAGVDAARPRTFQHHLRDVSRRDRRRQRHHQTIRPRHRGHFARTTASAKWRTAKFSTRSRTARTR